MTKPNAFAPVKLAALSVEDAAQALGIGRTHTYSLIKEGTLKAVKLGRRTLIPVQEVTDFLARLQKVAK